MHRMPNFNTTSSYLISKRDSFRILPNMAEMSSIHSLAADIQALPEYQPTREPDDPNVPQNPPDNPFFAEKDVLSRRVVETEQAEAEKWAWAWSYKFPQPILGHQAHDNRWPKIRDKVALEAGISIAKVPQPGSSAPASETDATIVARLLDAGADIIGYYSSATGPPPSPLAPESPQQANNPVGDKYAGPEPPSKRLRHTRTLEARQAALAAAEEKEKREKERQKKVKAKIVSQPWTEGYIVPCGTERGSAAAAALANDMIVGAAIGVDDGGADCMRVAASLYGCTAFKPTQGMVPMTGITNTHLPQVTENLGNNTIHLSSSVAVMTGHSAFEVACIMDVLAGYDGIDEDSLITAGSKTPSNVYKKHQFTAGVNLRIHPLAWWKWLKIALVVDGFGQPWAQPGPGPTPSFGSNEDRNSDGSNLVFQEEVKEKVLAAVSYPKDRGAEVEWVSVPEHLEGLKVWAIQRRIAAAAAFIASIHLGGENQPVQGAAGKGLGLVEYERVLATLNEEDLMPSLDGLSAETKKDVLEGIYLCKSFPGIYAKSVNIASRIRDAYQKVFETYGVVIMPTTPTVALKHGEVYGGPDLACNTAVFSVTGHPAMSICVGHAPVPDGQGGFVKLPVGMQIVGALGHDYKVMFVASHGTSIFGWSPMFRNP